MADAPQVAYGDADLEHVVTPFSQEKATILHDHIKPAPQALLKIFGVRRRSFWLVLVVAIVVIAVSVGGSVGSLLAVRSKESKSEHAIPTESITATPNNSTASSTLTLPTARYTPLAPEVVPLIDNICPPDPDQLRSRGGEDRYTCHSQQNLPGNDIGGLVAYTLQQCVDACSTMNMVIENKPCKAIVLSENLMQDYMGNGRANCWLKSTSQGVVDKAGVTVAVLKI